jgi:hypothetical protein
MKDWIERTFWLLALSVLGVLGTQILDLSQWWVPVIAVVIQQAKNYAAVRVGDPATAGFTDTRGG